MSTMTDTKPTNEVQAITTKLAMAISHLGGGKAALQDLQARLDGLTALDKRFTIGEITLGDDDTPVCNLEFNCTSYNPPFDGVPDPQAITDLRDALWSINPDQCLGWGVVQYFTADTV